MSLFKKIFGKKVKSIKVDNDTLDFEKTNPYNKYGRHRVTELLSELFIYFTHDDGGDYSPIKVGQLTVKLSRPTMDKSIYRIYFQDVLLFKGTKDNEKNYFGEWFHEGAWQDDINQNIKDFLQERDAEKDAEKQRIKETLSQYI